VPKTHALRREIATIALAAALVTATPMVHAQTYSTGGGGALGGGNAGALSDDGLGMIGGPGADAGLRGTGVIKLHNSQPQNSAPAPPTGAGYGTPGNTGNLGPGSNSGVGAGVENDIRTGITTSPNMR
jgi:hypothetical protein